MSSVAKISTFMYCEGAGVGPNPNRKGSQTLHIISPLHIITPEYTPTMFTFSAVFGILGVSTTVSHQLKMVFQNCTNSDRPLSVNEINLPPNPDKEQLPIDMQGFMLSAVFQNAQLDNDGYYETEVFLDSKSLGKFPIQVKGKIHHE